MGRDNWKPTKEDAMNIWSHDFEVGDVVLIGDPNGSVRLIEEIPHPSQIIWEVHNLELDIEGEHVFEDAEYSVVEVAE
jgi:hypothetical protein